MASILNCGKFHTFSIDDEKEIIKILKENGPMKANLISKHLFETRCTREGSLLVVNMFYRGILSRERAAGSSVYIYSLMDKTLEDSSKACGNIIVVRELSDGHVVMQKDRDRIILHPEEIMREAITLMSIATGIDEVKLEEKLDQIIQESTTSQSEGKGEKETEEAVE